MNAYKTGAFSQSLHMINHTIAILFILSSLIAATALAQVSTAAPEASTSPATSQDAPRECGLMRCLDRIPLTDDVYYTVLEPHSLKIQAGIWGLKLKELLPLNPKLEATSMLEPGDKILVHSRIASAPVPYAIGRVNQGILKDARLMPEGNGYRLRTFRQRAWGTDETIQALTTAFHAYHEKFPNAHLINLGEISKKNGGPLSPHLSHQTGRDVDIGFAFLEEPKSNHPEHFQKAKKNNFDAEKNWFLIQSLIQTGLVQVIYVDATVQKMLYDYAAPSLTQPQIDAIFSKANRNHNANAIIQHWPGHQNHYHIRFVCPANQKKCKP